ncbi:RNA polymerase sigma factor [Flavicella sediminum]|uniref:RNA polymerase sigma factor n=1 Tax=Flavicella sediminum TaxID=2585141 RepID=UPI00111EA244|nr:RNA polymerase sigma factor [Flavicella sediminum]
MTQTELIINCKNNDRKSQLKLYNTYCEGMFLVAKRYLKDMDEAEEAMQDGFVKAFKNLHQFKAEVSFGAWLKRIVINQCFDVLKKRELQTESMDDALLENVIEESWEVSDAVSVEEIKVAIENLPLKYSSVLQLYLMDGFDHTEISNIMEVAESTSRSLLHRGKKMIKEQLKHLNYGTRP